MLDATFIAYDVYDIQQNGLNWTNGLSLAADVGGLALPVVTGGGMMVRAAMHANDAVDTIKQTDRFIGANDNILRGVRTLENKRNAAKIWSFKHGYEKQLQRAYDLFQQGKLKGFEILGESEGRYDFILETAEAVEFKYWTNKTLQRRQDQLIEQITRYKKDGKTIILEFGETKTNPIMKSFVDDLLAELNRLGITDIDINIVNVP